MINGTTCTKAISISVLTVQTNKHEQVCTHPSVQDCWQNFTLTQTAEVVCLWSKNTEGLSFKFIINATTQPSTTTTPAQPLLMLSPRIFEIGPYIIRKTGQQQILFNPAWSLKQVKLLMMQSNVSEIQPTCSPFLQTSFEGWTTWLQKRKVRFFLKTGWTLRDVTGFVGTGLGILNIIDSEVLMNKLATTNRDLTELQQPL